MPPPRAAPGDPRLGRGAPLVSPFDAGAQDPVPISPFDASSSGAWQPPARGPPHAPPHGAAHGAPPLHPQLPAEAVAPTSAALAVPAAAPAVQQELHTEDVRYFVITSNTKENVVKSVKHGLWATQRKNEAKLDDAYREARAVILVFSVNRSEAFQGYALMRSPIGRPRPGCSDPFNGFGRLFDVQWLRLHDLPYREVEFLRNPLNGDQSVRFSRDGQELSNGVGRRLCGLIDRHIDEPESFEPSPQERLAQQPPPVQALPAPSPQATPATTAALPPPLPPAPLGPYGASRVPPGSAPIVVRKRSPSADSGADGDAEAGGRRRKKRRSERKYKNAPHPVAASFDDQIAYFLSLDYEDYAEWWRRHGAVAPGPALPAPTLPMPAPPSAAPPASMAMALGPSASAAPMLALGM
eukprot:TRINITY_DN1284_c1_g7_i1.p1 TRINITY_DN1284_c1_g7~~TRINITY_DN1284_c1_g7_i1.p1  ORF type:complete len:446 (-),score=95.47 TRINITY_DN1284_c1_g7_i1:180-1412(-)